MDSSRVWKFVKYLSFVIMAVLAVVLLVQYISLASLRRQSEQLDSDISASQNLYNQKTDLQNELEQNYDRFVEDQSKENNNMKNGNEEVLTGK